MLMPEAYGSNDKKASFSAITKQKMALEADLFCSMPIPLEDVAKRAALALKRFLT
jgi:hypothetical protein